MEGAFETTVSTPSETDRRAQALPGLATTRAGPGSSPLLLVAVVVRPRRLERDAARPAARRPGGAIPGPAWPRASLYAQRPPSRGPLPRRHAARLPGRQPTLSAPSGPAAGDRHSWHPGGRRPESVLLARTASGLASGLVPAIEEGGDERRCGGDAGRRGEPVWSELGRRRHDPVRPGTGRDLARAGHGRHARGCDPGRGRGPGARPTDAPRRRVGAVHAAPGGRRRRGTRRRSSCSRW